MYVYKNIISAKLIHIIFKMAIFHNTLNVSESESAHQ